ncbi:hypothetical protein [Leptospira ellisii]|uniref:hypothetical protein n=1 Tax=Leptospira ellisii TaxID=2023197 RepID=UPI0013FD3124|nr:hypothetical protein [Leptospira ellisii]
MKTTWELTLAASAGTPCAMRSLCRGKRGVFRGITAWPSSGARGVMDTKRFADFGTEFLGSVGRLRRFNRIEEEGIVSLFGAYEIIEFDL